MHEEAAYNIEDLLAKSELQLEQLNEDQRSILNEIMQRVHTGTPGVYFVSGHGGTGKTFLRKCTLSPA